MTGTWGGWYTEEKTAMSVSTTLDTIQFTMCIYSSKGDSFSGIAMDHIFHVRDGFGIIGEVDGKKISFKKFKTPDSDTPGIESVRIEDADSRIIYYHGILNINDSEVSGNWYYMIPRNLFGFIPLPSGRIRGQWAMKLAKKE